MAISNMQQPQQIQGGIGSLRDPRQGYFLGKLVKKAKRAVKKVVKSPLGKAALIAGLGFGVPGTGIGGLFGRASFGGAAKGLLGKYGIGATLPSLFGVPMGPPGSGSPGLFGKIGSFIKANPGKSALLGLGAAGIAAPFLMGGGEDEEEEIVEQIDPVAIRQRVQDFYKLNQTPQESGLYFMPRKQFVQRNFYAAQGGLAEDDDDEEFARTTAGLSRRQKPTLLNMGGGAGQAQAEQMLMMEYVKYRNQGGDMSFEQFVKAVMSRMQPSGAGMEQPRAMAQEGGIMNTEEAELIDMGGMEKDYRNTGGFVELGAEERADDVPARLSKNEFVFTADAVRNAGGGDIDKGAEVMENLMNNLEAGGEVSEDSQGLEGAQRMYEQQQMLQSRMI